MKVFLADNYVQVKEKIADIAEQHGNNLDEGLLVFCEEKFTMAIEQKIAERCGGGFNNEVSSFNLFLRKNSDRKNVLSRQSSSVVMRKIMSENADKLSCFNAGNKPTLPVTIYELIAQLKSAKVKPQDVSFAAENVRGTLKSKLSDIAFKGRLFRHKQQFCRNARNDFKKRKNKTLYRCFCGFSVGYGANRRRNQCGNIDRKRDGFRACRG